MAWGIVLSSSFFPKFDAWQVYVMLVTSLVSHSGKLFLFQLFHRILHGKHSISHLETLLRFTSEGVVQAGNG
jgi:hypothetical protein